MKEKYPAHELYFPGALKGTKGLNCLEEAMREWEALKAERHELLEALERAKEALKYCNNMAINGMASHRDAIHGKCIVTLNELRITIAKTEGGDNA